jgi:hypothetical protein
MLEGFLKGLKQPEYIHVLINPLPVYGLAMGVIGLIIGLVLRSREARSAASPILILIPSARVGAQRFTMVSGVMTA